jgi:hypothetical protein
MAIADFTDLQHILYPARLESLRLRCDTGDLQRATATELREASRTLVRPQ